MNVFKTSLLATALIAGGAIAPAHAAGTATTNFDVTIKIMEACTVAALPINFLDQTANPGVDVTAEGTLTVACSKGLDYNVALNGGSSGDITARQMTNGSEFIGYQLRMDSHTGLVWGETIGTDTETGTGTGFGASSERDITVYATATILGTETAGDYTDNITATVTF